MPSPITGPGSMNTPNNVQAPGMQGTLFNSPTVPESSNVPAIAAPAPLATPESVQAGNMAAPGGNAAAKTIGTTQVNAGMAPGANPTNDVTGKGAHLDTVANQIAGMGKPGADTSLLPPVKTPTPTAAPAPFGTSQGYSTFQSNVAKALASGQSYDQAKATAAKMSGGENTRPYELAMNLARGKLSNPNAFASRDTFNATYGYDQKSPEEKAMMDSFWNKSSEGTVDTSPNAVINAMSTPGQNFSQGIIASQLNMMKPNDIVNMVKSGTISESSPAFIDFQTKNPQAAAQYQQIKANQAKVDQINSTAITAHVLGAPDKLDPNKSLASQVKKPTEVSHPAVDALTGIQSRIQQTTKEFDNIHPNYGNLYQKSLTDNGFYDLNSQAMDAGKRVMGLQRDIQNVTLNLKANALTAGSTNTYIQEKAYQTTQQLSSQLFDASSSLTALNASMTRIQDTAKYQVQTQQMEDSMNKDLITSKLGALQSEAGIATTQAGYAQQEKMARLSSSLANPTLQSEDPQVRQNALREAAKGLFDNYGAIGVTSEQEIMNNVNEGIASGKYANEQAGIQGEMARIQQLPGFAALKGAQGIKATNGMWFPDSIGGGAQTGAPQPIPNLTPGQIQDIQSYAADGKVKTFQDRVDLANSLRIGGLNVSPMNIDSLVNGYKSNTVSQLTPQQQQIAEQVQNGVPYDSSKDPGGVILRAINAENPKMATPSGTKTFNEFNTSGSAPYEQIKDSNTVMGHIQEYIKAVTALKNGNQVPMNSLLNTFNTKFLGDSKLPVALQVQAALGNELGGAYGSTTAGEITDWKNAAPTDVNAKTANDWASEAKRLLGGKLDSANQAYKDATGKGDEPKISKMAQTYGLTSVKLDDNSSHYSDIFNKSSSGNTSAIPSTIKSKADSFYN